jgi:hypothetical protein|tara:strand:+ start:311 stop:508 length:198 start_codon:yes stop_codon:yes gene_type:complete
MDTHDKKTSSSNVDETSSPKKANLNELLSKLRRAKKKEKKEYIILSVVITSAVAIVVNAVNNLIL